MIELAVQEPREIIIFDYYALAKSLSGFWQASSDFLG